MKLCEQHRTKSMCYKNQQVIKISRYKGYILNRILKTLLQSERSSYLKQVLKTQMALNKRFETRVFFLKFKTFGFNRSYSLLKTWQTLLHSCNKYLCQLSCLVFYQHDLFSKSLKLSDIFLSQLLLSSENRLQRNNKRLEGGYRHLLQGNP